MEKAARVWWSRASWAPIGTVQAYPSTGSFGTYFALLDGEKRSVRRRYGQLAPLTNPAEELDRKLRQQVLADAIEAL